MNNCYQVYIGLNFVIPSYMLHALQFALDILRHVGVSSVGCPCKSFPSARYTSPANLFVKKLAYWKVLFLIVFDSSNFIVIYYAALRGVEKFSANYVNFLNLNYYFFFNWVLLSFFVNFNHYLFINLFNVYMCTDTEFNLPLDCSFSTKGTEIYFNSSK
jgi:hypothetical protein